MLEISLYLRNLLLEGKINTIEDNEHIVEGKPQIISVEKTLEYKLNPEFLIKYGDLVIRGSGKPDQVDEGGRVIDPKFGRFCEGDF